MRTGGQNPLLLHSQLNTSGGARTRERAMLGSFVCQEHGRSAVIREEATEQILEAKREKGLTFAAIAEKVGRHKVWTAAALLGQHPMDEREAEAVVDLLGLDPEVAEALREVPMRGSLYADVPVDPTIYRLHEITQVYGTTIKALIHEEFGDGIMSAVSFKMDVERIESDEGPRVRITYEGKFLPYKW
jgi:cyanate lyase